MEILGSTISYEFQACCQSSASGCCNRSHTHVVVARPLAGPVVQFFPMGTVSVNSGLSCRLDTLREKNAVKILVNCAYARKGTSASRNAAIAAAKLTKDAKCLQQLRECNGLEIIHNYVRI